MTINKNGGGYGQDSTRNITGTWDLSNYGLRPVPLSYRDTYNGGKEKNKIYKINSAPVQDSVPQVTVKPDGSRDVPFHEIGSLAALGKPQDVVPVKRDIPNAMKTYLPNPFVDPTKHHFIYNQDTSYKLYKIGKDTTPPTKEFLFPDA